VGVLSEGLTRAPEGSAEQLGLLYHLGKAHEEAGHANEAAVCYRQILDQDRSFLDVNERLTALGVKV
jgi:hypothetical protein